MSTTTKSTTTFFVIAKQDAQDLVTSALNAGRDSDEQAVLVFTSESTAQAYLQNAEWLQTETVAELQPAAFAKWLLDCRDNGVALAAIDPDRIHQEDGIRQTVVVIDELLSSLGPAIMDLLQATDFKPAE